MLNLAAGLDTRPYRLDLPAELGWVEADLAPLVAEKERLLADQTPRCRLSRHAVDLADPSARDAFLAEALAGATKAFVLTEGLLIAWWTYDFGVGGIKTTMNKIAEAESLMTAAWLPQPNPRSPGNKMWSAVACVTPPASSGQ